MKNIMLIGLISICLISGVSCRSTPDKEAIKAQVIDASALAISAALQCARMDLIKEDLTKLVIFKAEEAYEEKDEKSIYGTICQVAVSTAIPFLLKAGVPTKWECKLENANNLAKTVGSTVCQMI